MDVRDLDLSMIVAKTPDGVIGRRGTVPWTLRSDRERFKRITTEAGVVVMGFATWMSLPVRPLQNRYNIVLTQLHLVEPGAGLQIVRSFDAAVAAIREQGGRACVIGGATLYSDFYPQIREAHVTDVMVNIRDGDRHFPDISFDRENWKLVDHLDTRQKKRGDQYHSAYFKYIRR